LGPDWPRPSDGFDAPFPPGYEPDYSLVLTVTEAMAFDGTASVTGSLRDHSTYATNEPTALVWTAAIGGVAVNLRFSGETEYAASISSNCIFGTYWGATPDIEFELTEDDLGSTVVLTGTTSIGGVAVAQTAEILLFTLTATLVWSRVLNSGSDDWTVQAQIIGQESQYDADGRVAISMPGPSTSTSESLPDISASIDGLVGTITINTFLEEVYDVGQIWYAGSGPVDVTGTLTFTVTLNGEETIYTKSVRLTDDEEHALNFTAGLWLTIDGSDGTVTIINP
jgi:hypothetical protein